MAPEIIRNLSFSRCKYTRAIDVYSFGMIMYTSLELRAPWTVELASNPSLDVFSSVASGKRPQRLTTNVADASQPRFCELKRFCKLIEECWSQDPTERPPFNLILSQLQDMSEALSANMRSNTESVLSKDSLDPQNTGGSPGPSSMRSVASLILGTFASTKPTEKKRDGDIVLSPKPFDVSEIEAGTHTKNENKEKRLLFSLAPLPARPSPKKHAPSFFASE